MKVYKFIGRTEDGSRFIFGSHRAAKKFGCTTTFAVWRPNQRGWRNPSLDRLQWWWCKDGESWLLPVCVRNGK